MKIRTPVSRHHFQQAEFGRRQDALKSDVKQAMTQNVKTLGRQSHREKDLVEVSERAKAPQQNKSGDSITAKPGKEVQASPEQSSPPKEELFENFAKTMTEILGKEASVELLTQARELSSDEGQLEPCLAVLAHGVAKRALQEKRPGESKQQIREAAQQEPELAGMLKLADSAKAYLKAKKQDKLRSEPTNGYHLAPEKQAEMMAQNHESMLKVQEIYTKMAEDQRKHFEEVNQMQQETNRYLTRLWLEGHKKETALQDKQFQTFIEIIRGPTLTS